MAGTGTAGLFAAVAVRPDEARAAASQAWPPFVLVAGLLLIGLVADDERLFAVAGHYLARSARSGIFIFVGTTALIGLVTALLNLDTSVAFLTPVVVYMARSRGEGEAPFLYGSLLLANAASLFLPGSNLTNLIVLGHLHLSGGQFFAHMWAPGLAALFVTAAVVAAFEHRSLRVRCDDLTRPDRPLIGPGLPAVVAATILVVLLRSPAIPVAIVGLVTVGTHISRGRERIDRAVHTLGLPVLVGLFGVAVTLGTLGRSWSGPSHLLSHLDAWGTAAVAALAAVVINNLPASSLLAAHRPPQPYPLLIGLNVGPNLLVTGSLAWFLWLRAARGAGAHPSLAVASRFGLVAVPLALVAAVGLLLVIGT